jgi:Icc-related predicted phosphoesterase
MERIKNHSRWIIPSDTEILIAHGPPYGYVDNGGGNPELTEYLPHIDKLRVMCCGHIHGSYGYEIRDDKLYINAALGHDKQPFYFDYNLGGSEKCKSL